MDPVSRAQSETPHNRRKLRGGHDPSIGKATRFASGQSGNPGGRSKKSHVTKMMERVLSKPHNRKEIEKSYMDIFRKGGMATVLLSREFAERTEGKVADVVDMNVTGTVQLAEVIEERRKKRGNSDSRQS